MRKRKSPISFADACFCSYGFEESNCIRFIEQFDFDRRHDFFVDSDFYGIAVKIMIDRESAEKGVRRLISLCLVDTTLRCEVASRQIKMSMRKDQYLTDIYAHFPADSVELKAGHTYKLTISDSGASETLAVETFHLFGKENGFPENWYTVCDGGVNPSWDILNLYKSINTIDYHDYYVRFNLIQNFGAKLPEILPELEVRLHYPDGKQIDVRFMEPRCYDFENNSYFVQSPLVTTAEINGVFYAEVLCMQYLLAGFVFDTNREDERGRWYGREIEPLDEYTPEAAQARLNELLSPEIKADSWDNDFDEALDKFIQSEQAELGMADEIEDSEEEDSESNDEAGNIEACADSGGEAELQPLTLERLTGLTAVKEKLNVYERLMKFNKMRSDNGFPTPATPLHAMFLGSPGTGKTTVAKRIGSMLKEAGVLSKGHVVVRERASLLGMYYSSEGENTLKALEEAQGGILFIDEAYQLYQRNDPKDPGKFVIETLLTALADESNRDWMLILAGYPDEMKQMFEMNPGFKSRIPESNIYCFDDFTSAELMEIADNYLSRYGYELSADARCALADRLNFDYAHRDKSFGNARHVMNLIQTRILPAMAVRVIEGESVDADSLKLIKASDIPSVSNVIHNNQRPKIGFCA